MIRRASLSQSLPVLCFAALLVAPIRAHADPGAEARTFLEEFHQRIGALVSEEGATPDDKRSHVARELDAHLAYGFLAAAALGKQAERFSREEFAEFAHEYARFLTDFFLGTIAASEPEPLEILEVSASESGVVVIRTAGKARKGYMPASLRIPRESPEGRVVTYGLRKRGDVWRFVSVSFGGVDVTRTFRGQFESFLSGSEPAALTAELRKRNREAARKNPFTS